MDLVALQIFKTVAESGGISRAAARLHRVQSNVTTRIKQLEARLGTRLFHRRNRRLVLSDEGRILLDYAERLLQLASEAEAALRNTAPRGTLRLGSLESTAATRLPQVLAAYHRAWPDVAVELSTGTTGSLVDLVLRSELDAAFVAEPFAGTSLEMLHAFTETLVLILPPSGAGSPAHRPILAFAAGCSYRRRLEAWLQRTGVAPGRVMEYGSYHAIVACVSAGGGIAIVPESVLQGLQAATHVRVQALPRDIASARTQLVWRAGHQSGALDALKAGLLNAPRSEAPARSGAALPASRIPARRPGAARRGPRSSAPAASR
jgi:DNA-binding transcriptional LysR family regulator